MKKPSRIILHLAIVLLPALIVGTAAAFATQNLGPIFGRLLSGETGQLLSSVLGQLQGADIEAHLAWPLLLWGGFGYLVLYRKKPGRWWSIALLALGVLIISFLIALLLTTSNDIRVWDVLRALIKLLFGGLMDVL